MTRGGRAMDRYQINKYNKQLDSYRDHQIKDDLGYKVQKLAYPNAKICYTEKIKISGLHIEYSEFEKPVWKGIKRDKAAVDLGAEKRQESLEIRAQMETKMKELVAEHPDISVTENPEPIKRMNEIKDEFKEALSQREDNYKRKIQKLRDIIQSNFDIWTHFITLSFDELLIDMEVARSRLKDWTKKMKKIFPDFKYVYVVEFQKRGSIHFHIVCSMDPGKKVSKEKFNKVRGSWDWGCNTNGIDIKGINFKYKYIPKELRDSANTELRAIEASQKVKTIWSIGNYLTSYLKKDADSVLLFGNRMYGNSKGLKASIVITDAKKIAQIKRELGLDNLKEKTYEIKIKETENTVIKTFYNTLIKKPKQK